MEQESFCLQVSAENATRKPKLHLFSKPKGGYCRYLRLYLVKPVPLNCPHAARISSPLLFRMIAVKWASIRRS